MFNCGIQGVDFIVCNTDQVSLDTSPVSNKIKIGEGGLGAGNTPERARLAAEEAEEEIINLKLDALEKDFISASDKEILKEADIHFA